MKHLHHQFKTKSSTESLNITLSTTRSGSCFVSTSTFPTFRASAHQRGFTTRFLFLVTYLLSSIGIVCGICPHSCTCDDMYQSVNCTGISEVPKNIPNYTRFVSITNGDISELKSSDFCSLLSLRMLSLENNKIHTISSDCFNNSKKLRKLNLNGNLLTAFPEALVDLKRLNDLHLKGNAIVNLTTDKPLVLQKLQFLDLEDNNLTEVTRKFFESMSKLNTLKMSVNQIETIDDDWLSPLTNLEVLELETAFRTPPSIVEWFSCESLHFLSSINLAYNYITSFPSRTFNCLPNLSFLILNNNNITELPANLSLSSLSHLDLGFNQITHLRRETFQFDNNLTTLGLKSNQIQSLSKNVFRDLHRLEHLDLDYNYLPSIHLDTLASMTSLKRLLLSGNVLQVIHPELIHRHPNLRILDLSHNHIEELSPDFVQRTTLLNRLSLNNNYLVELPDVRNLENLQFLDISWNSLTYIPPDAFAGTSLQTINITENKIDTISWEALAGLFESGMLDTVMMDGNPIRCDCMISWAYEMRGQPEQYVSNFTCVWPIRFENQGFLQIPTYDLLDYLQCSDEVNTDLIMKIIVIWFSIVICIVFVYWIKVYHKSLKLWRAWSPNKRKRKCEVSNRGKSNTYYRISNDNFWNNNHLFTHRMTSSFRRVRLTESLQSSEYLETIV